MLKDLTPLFKDPINQKPYLTGHPYGSSFSLLTGLEID